MESLRGLKMAASAEISRKKRSNAQTYSGVGRDTGGDAAEVVQMKSVDEQIMETFKARAGQKYQPSNGTEGAMFMEEFCFRCKHDNFDEKTGEGGCPILAASFLDIGNPAYPPEWQYGNDGYPVCTAFEAEK